MKSRGRSPGPLIWIGVIGPVGLAVAAMAADLVVTAHGLCFDIAWTAAALSATVGSAAARSRAHPENRARWTLWALAAGSWLLGQIAWDVYGIVGFPDSPNLADAGWWCFALLAMASMLRPPPGPRAVRAVTAIEQIPLLFAAVCLCVGELWGDAVRSHLTLAAKLSDLAYPVLYVSATVLTLQAMVSGTLRGTRTPALRLMLAGITAQAVGFIFWSSELLAGTYTPGQTLLDPIWVIGLASMGIGGLLAARTPEPVFELTEPKASGVVLPGITFLALTAALGVQRLTGASSGAALTLRIGMLCSGGALIARSMVLARRMQGLLERERAARGRLAERESELARLNVQLLEDSRHDPLTGIGNRRALSDDMPMFAALQQDSGETIAVLLCDVDHFKAYNDRLGHLAGDQALRMVANTARGVLRHEDSAYRFGGEELLLVLRGVDDKEAVRVAERVRAAVRRAELPNPGAEAGILTVSVGVAFGDAELGELLARADRALYEAKRSGRDRVVAADHRTYELPGRARLADDEAPMPRHLRSMLSVSRAAAARQGAIPVAETLAEAIVAELSFQVVVVNLLEDPGDELRVVVVVGDGEARNTLLDRTIPLAEWERMLSAGEPVHGAAWLPAGSIEFGQGDAVVWTPSPVPSPAADAWHPEDMLLLPLRGSSGELLGVVSVDQPLLGRRPTQDEIGVLMAVVDHAGLALEQVQREGLLAQAGSDELRLAAVLLLAETLDLRDPSTALHSRTVGQLARMTAKTLGLSSERVERIQAAGVLHDLGKLGIADAILHKPGALSEAEWREMQRHPEVGARILEHAGMLDIARWVRWHHERLDGLGYPDGLAAGRIPLESRILAVADSYEAMIADRPYRQGMPREAAREELLRCAGTQFDPEVVAAFLDALAETAGEDHLVPLPVASVEATGGDESPLALRVAG